MSFMRTRTHFVPQLEIEGWHQVVRLLRVFHLADEVDFLLAGEEVNPFLAQHHHYVAHLVPKQPSLQ